MARRAELCWALARAGLIVSLLVTPASAQSTPETDAASEAVKGAARTLASKGIQLFEQRHYAEAFVYLERAQGVYPAPVHLVYMARARVAMGKLVEAKGIYEKVLAEPVPPDAAPGILETRKAAQDELTALRKRIPTVTVVVTGAPAPGVRGVPAEPGPVRLSVDGAAPELVANGPIELDPGEHTLTASAPGAAQAIQSVVLREGDAQKVDLPLGAPGAAGAPQVSRPADPDRARGSIVPAAIAFGVAGVALGVGAVTGALTLSKVSDLEDRCIGIHCPRSDADEADSAGTLAAVSTVAFVVAGVGAAAGITLLVIRPGAPSTSASVRAVVGPRGFGLRGRF